VPIITDGRIETGFIRERKILASLLRPEVPAMTMRYAEGIAKRTGLPLETIMRSKPFLNYLEAVKS
jgi:hypothetical protein